MCLQWQLRIPDDSLSHKLLSWILWIPHSVHALLLGIVVHVIVLSIFVHELERLANQTEARRAIEMLGGWSIRHMGKI